MTNRDIVKNYIYKMSKGEVISLEDYVREVFKGKDKVALREYCREQQIYYKKGSSRKMLLQRIYGMCKTGLSYKILQTSDIRDESIQDYYRRIYREVSYMCEGQYE
ncbi:Uncharacterised protein [uncultured Clostridium sp.]|uniref:hypothetical protein n=1 Tax=uncultured Clostridium sp. TaxID=59620 RepID=UPI000822B03A|nr:hypothetical protein [uncultured Clostridium sp.]SCJ50271.1 Uncharacterised protein [uncultured Clostridium sp.]